MFDFEVLKDLLDMVMDDETEVVDVKAGRKMTKDEVKEFLEELCDDGPDEEVEEEKDPIPDLTEETKKHVAEVMDEMGKEYAEDTVNLSAALTKIAYAMDNDIPIRHGDVDTYNRLIKKLLPKNSYPEYVDKQYAYVDNEMTVAKKRLGI